MLGFKRLSLSERGDTLVEVLISIAVISTILGGAFVLTNKSLNATRSAQERSSAMKVAESQIETIKSIAKSDQMNTVLGPTVTTPFCVVPSSLAVVSTANANCKFDALGNNNNTTEPVFNVAITRQAVGNDGYTFDVKITWNSISTKGTEQATMLYRMYR